MEKEFTFVDDNKTKSESYTMLLRSTKTSALILESSCTVHPVTYRLIISFKKIDKIFLRINLLYLKYMYM